MPAYIYSDSRAQFNSELWIAVSKLHGTLHHCTTAYHLQANRLVERFHRYLKSAFRARLPGPYWLDELPWVLFGIHTAPKEDLENSSTEIVHGSPFTVPGDFVVSPPSTVLNAFNFLPILREKVQGWATVPTSQHGTATFLVLPDLMTSVFVVCGLRCTPYPTAKAIC